jgi:DNA polymerase III epsilon subunit-like protein
VGCSAVGHIAIVDEKESTVLNVYVRPEQKVTSYLTALTSLDAAKIDGGVSLADAVAQVRKVLPKNAVLVGQNILKDVSWLNLSEGVDFAGMWDLAGLWRVFNSKFGTYSMFSLSHEARVLLAGYRQPEPHDGLSDAVVSMKVFQKYRALTSGPTADPAALAAAQKALIDAPVEPSFAVRNPTLDGVCMGSKRHCKCGAPFLF